VQKFDSNGNIITKWGSAGTADGQFSIPIGIAINSKGLVYVAESNNARVQIFAPSISK
jgi:sugar lactone lactonase YvrE